MRTRYFPGNSGFTRRNLIKSSLALGAAGLLSPLRPFGAVAESFEEVKSQYLSADIDWQQELGSELVVTVLEHPWTNALEPFLPQFTELTGINVTLQKQSEPEYVAQVPIRLGARNPTPDVFMVYSVGQAIYANWLEPVDPLLDDSTLTDRAWYDPEDIFESARTFPVGSDGVTYGMPITAEAQTVFINREAARANGFDAPPRTFDDFAAMARALKSPDMAGIAMRARPVGDGGPWPAAGFAFSFGGSYMTLDGQLNLTDPNTIQGIDLFCAMLRESGPIGVGNYHWYECVNDFMQSTAAMVCDSSTFTGDFSNPDKSRVAGNIDFGVFPEQNGVSKPNMWFWVTGINAASQRKRAAWLFLQWATSKPTCLLTAGAGLPTARASAWESGPFRDSFGEEAAAAAVVNLRNSDSSLMKACWFHPQAPQILDPIAVAINEVVTGVKDTEAALRDAQAKASSAIGQ